jgi:hypothetical protein
MYCPTVQHRTLVVDTVQHQCGHTDGREDVADVDVLVHIGYPPGPAVLDSHRSSAGFGATGDGGECSLPQSIWRGAKGAREVERR